MEASNISETSVEFYETTLRNSQRNYCAPLRGFTSYLRECHLKNLYSNPNLIPLKHVRGKLGDQGPQ
jgi:hypothetical protein